MNIEFSIAGDRPPFDEGYKNDYIDIKNESKKPYKQGKNSFVPNSYGKAKQDIHKEFRPKTYQSPKTQPRADDSNSPYFNKNKSHPKQNFTKNEHYAYQNQQQSFSPANRKIQPIPASTPPKQQPSVRQFQPSPAPESITPSFNPQPSSAPSFNPQPKPDVPSTPSPAKEQQTTPNSKPYEFPQGHATDSPRPTPTKDKKSKSYKHPSENQNYSKPKPKPKSNSAIGALSEILD